MAHVQLEQNVGPQAAIVAIDNPTGEIKAMVGGYSFDESKFNRATQAQRQVGSSFKIYVYSAAMEQGFTPFDTILDAPFTTMSGGQPYSPHNYDEKFEGVITLRRALDGSRNVPAVKLAEKIGMNSVIDMARRFGITSPLPPYLAHHAGRRGSESARTHLGVHRVSRRRHPHRSAHDSPRDHL